MDPQTYREMLWMAEDRASTCQKCKQPKRFWPRRQGERFGAVGRGCLRYCAACALKLSWGEGRARAEGFRVSELAEASWKNIRAAVRQVRALERCALPSREKVLDLVWRHVQLMVEAAEVHGEWREQVDHGDLPDLRV